MSDVVGADCRVSSNVSRKYAIVRRPFRVRASVRQCCIGSLWFLRHLSPELDSQREPCVLFLRACVLPGKTVWSNGIPHTAVPVWCLPLQDRSLKAYVVRGGEFAGEKSSVSVCAYGCVSYCVDKRCIMIQLTAL